MMTFLIFVDAWIICGVIVYARVLAYYQQEFPTVRDKGDAVFAFANALFGPLALIAFTIWCPPGRGHGFQLIPQEPEPVVLQGPHFMGEARPRRLRNEPTWDYPDDAQMQWARATMPRKGRVTDHVVATRTWNVASPFLALPLPQRSQFNNDPVMWPLFVLQARACEYVWMPHEPAVGFPWPTFGRDHASGPGIYAINHAVKSVSDIRSIIGRVALWGTVVEHSHGYRAQFAYPLELWVLNDEIAEHLAATYNIPVHNCMPPSNITGLHRTLPGDHPVIKDTKRDFMKFAHMVRRNHATKMNRRFEDA